MAKIYVVTQTTGMDASSLQSCVIGCYSTLEKAIAAKDDMKRFNVYENHESVEIESFELDDDLSLVYTELGYKPSQKDMEGKYFKRFYGNK
jgi:hypothetical protein